MSEENKISKINKLNAFLIVAGTVSLVFSYLFFINIIGIPIFNICGSACEWWWSWLINFPPQGACIEICIMRNSLYKPFFVIGVILDTIGLILGALEIFRKS